MFDTVYSIKLTIVYKNWNVTRGQVLLVLHSPETELYESYLLSNGI